MGLSQNLVHLSNDELQSQRESLRVDLVRANTQGLAIVLVVIGLAVAAVALAYVARLDANRAELHAAVAEAEKSKAEEQLYQTSLAQARVQRQAGEMGQRVNSLLAVKAAARIHPSAEAREQAIAALALMDFQDTGIWRATPTNTTHVAADYSGDLYAVVPSRQLISVRRFADNQEIFRLTNNLPADPDCKFSPDGTYLLVSSGEEAGILAVWNLRKKSLVFKRTPAEKDMPWVSMGFSPDGSALLHTDSKGFIRSVHLESGRQSIKISGLQNPNGFAVHPTRNIIAVDCENDIQVWNLDNNQLSKRISRRNGIGSIAWSPDGRLLAIGYSDSSIHVWDLEHDRAQVLHGHTREIVQLLFHPNNGSLLSYSWDNTSRLWDPVTGAQLLETSGFMPLTFSRDGKKLSVWRKPEGVGLLQVISPTVCRLFTTLPGTINAAYETDFSPDSSLLAASTHDGVAIWNVVTGNLLRFGSLGGSRNASFLNSTSLLAVSFEGLDRWQYAHDPVSDQLTVTHLDKLPIALPGRLGSYSLSQTRELLVGHLDGTGTGTSVDLVTGKLLHLLKGNPGFSVPVFSPDGNWIASGCWNPTVTKPMFASVWNARTGTLVTNFPSTKCTMLFSPDSRWLLLGASSEYRLMETGSWKPMLSFTRSEDMVEYGQAAFSNDGQLLALHATDRVLRLVHPATGQELARLHSPDRSILKALRFSSDNRWLAAATEANVQVWDIPALRQNLGELGLDWSGSNEEIRSITLPRRTPLSRAHPGGGWFWLVITPILLAMLAAIGLALSQRRHQAAMMRGYVAVDAMIISRNEQLDRARTELLHTQKMRALGSLAAGIAHDFNNLLSIIRLSNQLAARAARTSAEVQENSADIEKAVVQGKSLVRSMLGYSRESAEEGQPCSLAELMESVVGLLGKQFLSGITLTLELEPDLPLVSVGRARLEQILLNLIVNASEAMNGQGKLRLAARRRPSGSSSPFVLQPRPAPAYIEALVADTGPGIDPDALPRIFEPFFTTKNIGATRGTGLGLSMVYTVAREDGLGICVDSSPTAGTAFLILIPLNDPLP